MIQFFYPPQPIRLWSNSDYFLKLSRNTQWDAEIKYNGWRCLIFKFANKIQLFNRHGTIIDFNSSVFTEVFKKIPNDTVFDAELVNFRSTDFKNIVVIFDTPYYNGKDLRSLPLIERRKYYGHFLTAPEIISPSDKNQVFSIRQYTDNFLDLYNLIIKRNLSVEEGLVIKKKISIYRSHLSRGIDVNDWIKVKKAA